MSIEFRIQSLGLLLATLLAAGCSSPQPSSDAAEVGTASSPLESGPRESVTAPAARAKGNRITVSKRELDLQIAQSTGLLADLDGMLEEAESVKESACPTGMWVTHLDGEPLPSRTRAVCETVRTSLVGLTNVVGTECRCATDATYQTLRDKF